jgi:large subunit ribosomal protein L24
MAKRLNLEIHAGDTVQVRAGKDRGKRGVVERVVPAQNKIVVKGVNMAKRHTRALQQKGSTKVLQGGVVDFEAPLAYSNVLLVCPKCDKPTRIKKELLASGERVIKCIRCGNLYERAKVTF